MNIYYYLDNKKNDEWFKQMMNAFDIKYWKSTVNIFDKKYLFITIENEKCIMFSKLAMVGVFVDLPLHAFTSIN